MKERPILFSAPMVIANRAGIKSQTRRTRGLDRINEAPDAWEYDGSFLNRQDRIVHIWQPKAGEASEVKLSCPYGEAGDRLWVREAWKKRDGSQEAWYRADGHIDIPGWPWKPSIHMPRWASRDTLEIINVRPERLQDITEADAIAEGIILLGNMKEGDGYGVSEGDRNLSETARDAYRKLWASINGPGSWAKNSWLWRIEYRKVQA